MRHRGIRRLAAALVLAGLALLPVEALAAQTYTDGVSGIEIAATSTEGQFTGVAGGDLPGYWYADVVHTPLGGQAEITGGSFDLYTYLHNQSTEITGTFSGGTVDQVGGFSDCANQVYTVTGQLTSVGVVGRPDKGTGSFDATLTHYRADVLGICVTYGASISGTVVLSF